MGMLGALHKLTLGTAPQQLAALLPSLGAVAEPRLRQGLRGWRPLHDKQLRTPCSFRSTDLMKRSLFGLALCYNALPQDLANVSNVKLFQRKLQQGLVSYAEKQDGNGQGWERLYCRIFLITGQEKTFFELFNKFALQDNYRICFENNYFPITGK